MINWSNLILVQEKNYYDQMYLGDLIKLDKNTVRGAVESALDRDEDWYSGRYQFFCSGQSMPMTHDQILTEVDWSLFEWNLTHAIYSANACPVPPEGSDQYSCTKELFDESDEYINPEQFYEENPEYLHLFDD